MRWYHRTFATVGLILHIVNPFFEPGSTSSCWIRAIVAASLGGYFALSLFYPLFHLRVIECKAALHEGNPNA